MAVRLADWRVDYEKPAEHERSFSSEQPGRPAELPLKPLRHVYLMARTPHYCLNLLLWVYFTSLRPLAALPGRQSRGSGVQPLATLDSRKLVRRYFTCATAILAPGGNLSLSRTAHGDPVARHEAGRGRGRSWQVQSSVFSLMSRQKCQHH